MLGKRIFTMHDPLAVAVALDPTLVETRRAAVDVETTGRLTTGATIVDWRGQWGRLANTEVAVAVDAERFRRLFFDAMARLADGRGGEDGRVLPVAGFARDATGRASRSDAAGISGKVLGACVFARDVLSLFSIGRKAISPFARRSGSLDPA